jgi:hypothetical protein
MKKATNKSENTSIGFKHDLILRMLHCVNKINISLTKMVDDGKQGSGSMTSEVKIKTT